MINIRMQNKDVKKLSPKITVVGVGGAGGNAVNNMISSGLQGVEFVVCNTDAQALDGSLCDVRVQLGATVTGGLGAGAKPEVGRAAAEETLDEIMQHIEGANMAFITAGMGGGTGTGAAPVIAQACREKGVLTVGVVTKPFHFEGTLRMKMAEAGIQEMQQYVDTLIIIPNQNLFRVANEKTTFAEAFRMADSVLQSGVRGVTDLMVMPGLINLDFADIRSAMLEMGKAMMGTGEASGERRAVEAAEKAINNPLLDDVSMKGARGVIINVTGGYDMTLFEVDEACNRIRDEVDPNANIIFGSTFEESLEGVMRVSVVATGIDVAESKGRRPVHGASTVNAVSAQQQERRFERAQPAAAVAQSYHQADVVAEAVAPVAVAAQTAAVARTPVYGSAISPSIPVTAPLPLTVRAPAAVAAATAGALARKVEEVQQVEVQQDVAVEVAPQVEAAQAAGSLRGTVYGESFIPPRPVEPGAARAAETAYGSPLGSLSARRTVVSPEEVAQTVAAPGLSLKPPVATGGTAAPQKKRAPSLFERFTGPLWHHGGAAEDKPVTETAVSVSAQGSLNIEPVKADAAEDDLDIPAFLRRQAN